MGFGLTRFSDYLDASEHDPLVIVQIESIAAVKDLKKIVAVEGIGSICIGPYDLSGSMGKLGDTEAADVQAAIDESCACARQAGMMIGSVSGTDPKSIRRWKARGANWLAVCSDYSVLAGATKNALEQAGSAIPRKRA